MLAEEDGPRLAEDGKQGNEHLVQRLYRREKHEHEDQGDRVLAVQCGADQRITERVQHADAQHTGREDRSDRQTREPNMRG